MKVFCFEGNPSQITHYCHIPGAAYIAKTHICSKKPYIIFMYYYNTYMYLHSCEIAHFLLYSNCSIKWFEDDGQNMQHQSLYRKKASVFGLFPGLLFSVQKSEWAVNGRKSYMCYLSTYSNRQNKNSL